MEQRPELGVAAQNDVTTPAAVSSVGSSFINKLFAMKVQATRAPFSGTRAELHIVDKVWIGQCLGCLRSAKIMY